MTVFGFRGKVVKVPFRFFSCGILVKNVNVVKANEMDLKTDFSSLMYMPIMSVVSMCPSIVPICFCGKSFADFLDSHADDSVGSDIAVLRNFKELLV